MASVLFSICPQWPPPSTVSALYGLRPLRPLPSVASALVASALQGLLGQQARLHVVTSRLLALQGRVGPP